jgi:PLP dependent protein
VEVTQKVNALFRDYPQLLEKAITVVAVSKYATLDQMREAFDAGIRDFGENKVQVALQKQHDLPESIVKQCKWHLLGALQKNKVSKAASGAFDLIHSIDSVALAEKISTTALSKQAVLLQVNLTREPQKTGFLKETLRAQFSDLLTLPGLKIEGLMCMGPNPPEKRVSTACFQELSALAQELRGRYQIKLPKLSMGMSQDFEFALNSDATIIRVGHHLFG